MNSSNILIWTLLPFLPIIFCVQEDAHLQKLFNAVKSALYSRSPTNSHYYYQPEHNYISSNGISLGIYKALLSITKNDDLECVFRLLCEAAAGGRPGYSGREVNFDKTSLTKFVSYLNLGSKTSPFLAFAKAALLGVSNRGDPYSCIINYSKCPRDQSRLLYYLNNHRGGFFQYFDGRGYNDYPNNYNYNNYNYNYNNYANNGYRSDDRPIKYKKKKIIFENSNFYSNLKKKATFGNGVYAQKYAYSSFKFPTSRERDSRGESNQPKPVVFPQGKDTVQRYRKETKFSGNPRILNRTQRQKFHGGSEHSIKFPKKVQNDILFFPDKVENGNENKIQNGGGLSSDRLPPNFHFPAIDDEVNENTKPSDFKENSFFPE